MLIVTYIYQTPHHQGSCHTLNQTSHHRCIYHTHLSNSTSPGYVYPYCWVNIILCKGKTYLKLYVLLRSAGEQELRFLLNYYKTISKVYVLAHLNALFSCDLLRAPSVQCYSVVYNYFMRYFPRQNLNTCKFHYATMYMTLAVPESVQRVPFNSCW